MLPFQLTDKYSQVESKLISAPWGHGGGGRGVWLRRQDSFTSRCDSLGCSQISRLSPSPRPCTQQLCVHQSLPTEDSLSPFPNGEGIAHTWSVDKIQGKSPSSASRQHSPQYSRAATVYTIQIHILKFAKIGRMCITN